VRQCHNASREALRDRSYRDAIALARPLIKLHSHSEYLADMPVLVNEDARIIVQFHVHNNITGRFYRVWSLKADELTDEPHFAGNMERSMCTMFIFVARCTRGSAARQVWLHEHGQRLNPNVNDSNVASFVDRTRTDRVRGVIP